LGTDSVGFCGIFFRKAKDRLLSREGKKVTKHDIGFYLGLISAAVASFWASLPFMFQLLIVLMAADIATGIAAAVATKELSSDTSFRGIAKKAIILIVVAVAGWLEPVAQVPIGQAVAGFYAAHEGISLLENAAKAGLPVPKFLKAALLKLAPPEEDNGR
jgi:toxin secretion/phage lysis holin